MSNKLTEALQASASFKITNNASGATAKKLCFLPGIYDTREIVLNTSATPNTAHLCLTATGNLSNAGYTVDQVADDYITAAATKMPVQITSQDMCAYRDFLNKVQRDGVTVTKITLKNYNSTSDAIFNQVIEVAKTALGAKGGTDYIRVQKYVSVNAYDRTKVEIDLTDDPLNLTGDIFMAMNVPAAADFSITFDFA